MVTGVGKTTLSYVLPFAATLAGPVLLLASNLTVTQALEQLYHWIYQALGFDVSLWVIQNRTDLMEGLHRGKDLQYDLILCNVHKLGGPNQLWKEYWFPHQ